jgi:AcrR family transcriptional regulator
MDMDARLAEKFTALFPHLNERQRRVCAAAEARALGHGGIARVARAAGLSRPTIYQGLRDLDQPPLPGRVRRAGGGRPAARDRDPELLAALDALIEPDTRGDPESPLRWTCKSTRQLAAALTAQGHPVSHSTVADLLRAADYSLQAPRKTLEGSAHPDRDAQFRYLNERTKAFQAAGLPVISVDTKKKELVGPFKNGGREWRPQGRPELVNVHDFPAADVGKAIPYGVYDVTHDAGWVAVGQDHDTASFAVATISRWWEAVGQPTYPRASHLLISADGGGSNGYRTRLWKTEMQRFADATGLHVTVCHLPPGTSKWNKIEHRLFAHISTNWRGRPLVSHEVVVELIGATTTRTGLRVRAERDTRRYPTKVKVPDAAMAALSLTPHAFHGEWNYTIHPRPSSTQA